MVMKLSKLLSRVNELVRYLKLRKKRKLYTQWVEMAGLPCEAVPEEIIGVNMTYRQKQV